MCLCGCLREQACSCGRAGLRQIGLMRLLVAGALCSHTRCCPARWSQGPLSRTPAGRVQLATALGLCNTTVFQGDDDHIDAILVRLRNLWWTYVQSTFTTGERTTCMSGHAIHYSECMLMLPPCLLGSHARRRGAAGLP